MRVVVVIPARFKSSRFPGKPLVPIAGRPMIHWVADLSAQAVGRDNVYVATDDQTIREAVEAADYKVVMTTTTAATGTDRLAEAAHEIGADIFVNVQGDEPLLDPQDICKVADEKRRHPREVINGYCWIGPDEDPWNVNIPKVITTEQDYLIYMSRSALPAHKDPENVPARYKKQVCVYGFSLDELEAFHDFGRKSYLESYEDIEILRFLDLGIRVRMVETNGGSLAVDVPQDVAPVERALRSKHRAD